MKSILIIGGAGFIGGHLAKKLLEQGNDVHILDNYSFYKQVPSAFYQHCLNLRFEWLSKSHFYKMDICQIQKSADLFHQHFDEVIHFAANPVAHLVEKTQGADFAEIENPTLKLLQLLKLNPPKRIIYISSSMVYGHFTQDNIQENNELKPVNRYGVAKLKCEKHVVDFCNLNKIKHIIVRPSAVYGEDDTNSRILFRMISSSLLQKKIVIQNWAEKLDFTHVDDLCLGLSLIVQNDLLTNEVFNLTTGSSKSLLQAKEIIEDKLGSIVYDSHPLPINNPVRGSLSNQKAFSLLGYCPQISFAEGLSRYCQVLSHLKDLI